MRPEFVRVVYDNQPYLIVRHHDGSLDRACGPFTRHRPNLGECTDERLVTSVDVRATLAALVPIQP